jgi:hypothetical protein
MNYEELLQALLELKEKGNILDKLPVVYVSRKGRKKPISEVKVFTGRIRLTENCIELRY